jgi:hypothetical protein
VVAVISYASAAGLLHEALLTCDDTSRATDLRSYWDTERFLTFLEAAATIEIRFKPGPVVRIPVAQNGLDLRRAILPAGFHLTAWKR